MRPPKSAITDTVTQYEYPDPGIDRPAQDGLPGAGDADPDARGHAAHPRSVTASSTRWTTCPIDDPKIYELLTSGDVMGVFQVEGAGMRRVPDGLAPQRVRAHRRHHLALPPRPHGVHPRLYQRPARREAAAVRAPAAGADPGRDDGGLRLSGAGHPDPDRHRGLHYRRGRSGATRHQQEVQESPRRASRDLREGRQEKIRPDARGNRQDLGRVDGFRRATASTAPTPPTTP